MITSTPLELYYFVLISLTILYSIGLHYLKSGLKKTKMRFTDNFLTVSIVVSMHNEENNVAACLDKLLALDYPESKLEIIIINDRSTDNTEEIINQYLRKSTLVRLITIKEIQKDITPKKHAIDQAIQKSKGEIILLTDADGRPDSQWVNQIASAFTSETGMVIGYAPYKSDSSVVSFSKQLLSLEYLSHAAVAAATCGIGYPLTCVGTNMAYRKSVYKHLGGFGVYKKLHTGDDDLFLQRVRDETSWKITYVSGHESHVYNEPPKSWRTFLNQRIRYASKGFKYPPYVTLILILFYLLNLILLISPLTFIFSYNYLLPYLAAIFLKSVSDYNFLKSAASILEDNRFLNLLPVAFFLHIPYVVFFGLMAQIKSFKWADHSS
jgi:cellulose synthase/poly-beta-1,6-N-acetylglucosamine synthase-like glycosyltransferase